jgi:hypothetical protein
MRTMLSSSVGSLMILYIGLATACHPGEARNRCSELAEKLYEARRGVADERLPTLLTSKVVGTEKREALVTAIRDRDLTYGAQESRRRYLSNVAHKSEVDEDWFLVRNGYRIRYSNGETWEDVICRVDLAGRNAVILDVEFGPSPHSGHR